MEYMSNKGAANPLESKVERTILKMFRCLVAERLTPIAEEDMDKLFEKFGLNGSDVSRADFGKDIRKAALATKEFEMRKLSRSLMFVQERFQNTCSKPAYSILSHWTGSHSALYFT